MRVLVLAAADLRLTLRERSSLFWVFLAPILWVYFFANIQRGPDPSRTRIGLLAIQADDSSRARQLVEHLRTESFDVRVQVAGEVPAEGNDTPSRRLTIPAGFGEAIAARRRVGVTLVDGKGASPEGTLAAQVALHRAIVRLLADEVLGPVDPRDDVVQVRSSWARGRQVPSGVYQSLPGNLVMFVLIATMTYGAALLAAERRKGLLRRLRSSPLTTGELVLGKALGRALLATVQIGVFLLAGLVLFRIDWGSSPAGLAAVLAAYAACAAALSLLSGTLFATPEAAAGAGTVSTLVMSALGGCWWPAEVAPAWMRVAGHAFPTAWAMDGLHQVISWGGGLEDVLVPCAVLLAYALAASTLAARRLGHERS